jgi:sporulation protein YlmC with PRC-barrel domain
MLKKTLMAGVAATVLIGAPLAAFPAFAQNAPSATVPASDSMKADKLIGHNVVNARNETVGDINAVYVGKDGMVDSVIVGVGGFLGMGEREVALKWSDLTVTDNGNKIMVNATMDQMKAMPEYKYSDTTYRGKVFADNGISKTPPMIHSPASRTGMDRNSQNVAPSTSTATVAPGTPASRSGMDRNTQNVTPSTSTATVTPGMPASRSGMDRDTQDKHPGAMHQADNGKHNPAMRADGTMSSNAIVGADVKNASNETIGTVQDLYIDSKGAVKGVVVGVGGFLGIGERNVMLSWDNVKLREGADHDGLIITTDATKDSLKAMPEYKQSMLR